MVIWHVKKLRLKEAESPTSQLLPGQEDPPPAWLPTLGRTLFFVTFKAVYHFNVSPMRLSLQDLPHDHGHLGT